MGCRGGPRNSSGRGGGGGSGPEFFKGGVVRVQVDGNFHIMTSLTNFGGGGSPSDPPLGFGV